ncbi:hypothetical protein C7974DRAFT_235419 [Boeremia exigua]|uniref:uncharacterized protein n=1 Tax=Boeremia exigua TaxID=749465 RepID=UPI001E8E7F56|nr:uncharacterized protein C7974DRAFT_235419 [Boeremia exigua]KAH6620507.1 hypothetical protein C7974DRAFT_235419 [Boeremia exigua]
MHCIQNVLRTNALITPKTAIKIFSCNTMLSYYLAALTSILALAASAPTPAASLPGLASVDLRIVGPQNTHYTTTLQAPTSDQSQHLTVIVGQMLALERDPLHIQGVQISAVKAGESLSMLPGSVEKDDWRVACSARVEGMEDVVTFDITDKGVLLAGGRLVKVTRLSCSVNGEAVR